MTDVNRLGDARSGRWQDWVNLVLAVWLFISPWVLGFAAGRTVASTPAGIGATMTNPSWDAWIFGVITAIVALSAMFSRAPWQEWISLLIGIWLFIAPWVLAFSGMQNPAWDHWIVGALVFLVALSALSFTRGAVSYSHAGQKPLDTTPPPLDRR
jgi:hypothetical protein